MHHAVNTLWYPKNRIFCTPETGIYEIQCDHFQWCHQIWLGWASKIGDQAVNNVLD